LEHKEQNPKLTIGSFFKIHYDNPVKDSDYTKDQQLPFVSRSASYHRMYTCDTFYVSVV
jgi:hypothetical protein